MGLIHVVVVFMQCIYAVVSTTSQDAVLDSRSNAFDISRPIAVVAVPAPSQPGFDGESASFYAVEAEPEVNQLVDSIDDSVGENSEIKRTLGMLRMGRAMRQREGDEKRSMGMLRMGKRSMGMLRMGRSSLYSSDEDAAEKHYSSNSCDDSNNDKRSMGMLRMGRSMSKIDANDDKRSMGMLRMGRSMSKIDANDDKRTMGMLRMGRSMSKIDANDDKRSMGMLRMGRSSPDINEEKKSMAMLRMGRKR